MMDETVPITLLTGFLGSGKSTFINSLLRNAAMPPTAVVVNELGEIGIDNLLVETVTEGVTVLTSGCLCCAVRSDLEQSLRDLRVKRLRGVVPPFERLLLETTGLAKPAPILQTLMSGSVREMRYEIGAVVATVDAVAGLQSLERFTEARQQVAVADRLIVTKSDLTGRSEISELKEQLFLLNPDASVFDVARGSAEPEMISGPAWLTGKTAVGPLPRILGDGSHSVDVRADSYFVNSPIDWERLQHAIRLLMREEGDHLLRFKALARVQGIDHLVALHAVHHTFYPPEVLPSHSDWEGPSRLVFISQGIDRTVIDEVVRQFSDDR